MRSWRKIYAKTLESPDVACLSDGAIVLLTFLIIAQDDSGYYPWDDTSIRRVTVTRTSWSRDVTDTFAEELVTAGIARMEQGGIILVKGEELNGKPRKDVDIELYLRDRLVNTTSTPREQHVALEQSRVEQSRVEQKDVAPLPTTSCSEWVRVFLTDKRFTNPPETWVKEVEAEYKDANLVLAAHACLDWLQTTPKGKKRTAFMRSFSNWLENNKNGGPNGKFGSNPEAGGGRPLTVYRLPDGQPLLGSKPKTML